MTKIIKVNNEKLIHTVDDLKEYHDSIKVSVQNRLHEFKELGQRASAQNLFRELAFCILTANASARMGQRAIAAIEPKLFDGQSFELEQKLRGCYRFPRSRADYIYRSRMFLIKNHDSNLRNVFNNFKNDNLGLREYLKKNIIGIGFKECSHFLRNIGFTGFAILDKHVVSMLCMLGYDIRKPRNGKEYVAFELKMKEFANKVDIDIDELDLVFWSYKTGEIIK